MQTAIFSGLTCDACIKLISKRLMKLPGVTSINGDKSGVFEIQSSQTHSVDQINQIISGTEYTLKNLK